MSCSFYLSCNFVSLISFWLGAIFVFGLITWYVYKYLSLASTSTVVILMQQGIEGEKEKNESPFTCRPPPCRCSILLVLESKLMEGSLNCLGVDRLLHVVNVLHYVKFVLD